MNEKEFKAARKKWHVVMGLMDPPVYRAEKETATGTELSKWFKSNKEAEDFITSQSTH